MPNSLFSGTQKTGGQALWLLGLALIPAAVSLYLHPQRPYIDWLHTPEPVVEITEVKEWGPKVLWVDSRAEAYFESEHMEGAILLNEDNWDQQIAQFSQHWSADVRVVVYCDTPSCRSSRMISHRLRTELGVSKTYVLKTGWKQAKQEESTL